MAIMKSFSDVCNNLVSHPSFKPISIIVCIALVVFGSLTLITKRAEVAHYFKETVLHPDLYSERAAVMGGIVAALAVGLLFGIEQLCNRYILNR